MGDKSAIQWTDATLEEFARERDAAFLSLDRAQIEAFAAKYGIALSRHDEVFWASVHKGRTAAKHLPTEARAESKRWLLERGYSSFDDGDI